MGRKVKNNKAQQGLRVRLPDEKGITLNRNMLHPAFSFKYLSLKKDYSLDQCDKREKIDLLLTIFKLSQMPWNQIQSAPRHGMGHEIIKRSAIKTTIPSNIGEDVRLLSFRFSGKRPMVGYRQDKIFYILWLDCKFKLYDHGG